MFKKIYFRLAILSYYFKKNYLFLILGLIIGTTSFIYRNKFNQITQLPFFNTKYVGISGLYTSKNLPYEIQSLISSGLTINSDNEKPQPSNIVESITITNDNRTYLIKIKNNIFWHDGKKLTAADINYDIAATTQKVIDNQNLSITTNQVFAPLLSLLEKPLYRKNFIGLGPNKVLKITYKYGYINTLTLQNITNNYKTVYHFYQNDDELLIAFKLGEIQEIETTLLPSDIEKWNKIKINKTIESNKKYLAVFFNTEKITNKQTRQALTYATPKAKDRNERAMSPISPSSWAYNSSIKEYNLNPTRAKELFEPNKIDSINLIVTNRQLLSTAEEIKKSWHDILGINVNITVPVQIDYQNADAILAFGGIPNDPDQYPYWHSTQSDTNVTRLNNSRIDKLLEEGRQTFDLITRKQIYQEFQKYLLEECPAIFLSYPTVYSISRL
jgi:peptide/nickel transport system substrate-binding protein